MVRMLTLTHNLMAGDQPLPTTMAAVGPAGEPGAAVSTWAAQLAAASYAPVGPHSRLAHEFSGAFHAVATALAHGRFSGLRESLLTSCKQAKSLAAASGQPGPQHNASFGPEHTHVLVAWVQDCSTLVQYTPSEPPAREDHKRLLLLLHDLGAPLLMFALLDRLPEALVGVNVMAELAAAILQLGGGDRRTAVTLGLFAASADADGRAAALGSLEQHGHCAAGGGESDPHADLWGEVGVRLCALLQLRTGRPDAAVQVRPTLPPPTPAT